MARKSNIEVLSIGEIEAEIERRRAKLPELIEQRNRLNEEIAVLQSLGGNRPAKKTKGKRGKKKAGAKRRKRYDQTADEFVLGLLKGKTLTTAQLNAAWDKAGRGGKVDNVLTKVVKSGQVKRSKLDGQGSNYSLA